MGRKRWTTIMLILAVLASLGFQRGSRQLAGVTTGIVYARPSGSPLRLDVQRPSEGTGHPVVVLVHGGSWRIGSRSSFVDIGARLAAEGFVTVSIDYRLTPDGAVFPQPLKDVQRAITWTIAHARDLGGDPERIGILGSSAGGHLALLAASDPRVKAVAAWSPPTDLASLHARALGPDIERLLGCSPQSCPDRYRRASPALSESTLPPLYLASSNDESIPSSQHTSMVRSARTRGGEVEETIVEGSDHGMELAGRVTPETVAFFKRYLAR